MQATQSSTAWDSRDRSGQFVALRHVVRTMKLNMEATPVVRGPVVVAARDGGGGVADTVADGVAEGAGLAHDAGNLLGALSLYSDLLALPGVLHEEHREYAAELRLISDRSWAMIDRLVNHARAERYSEAEASGVVAQTTVLPEVVDRCRGLLSKVAGQAVEVSYGAGAMEPVRVPTESVERILTNLVKNAAEASPWVGAISVRVEGLAERVDDHVRQRVVMTVQDKGCGMDEATVRRLAQGSGIAQVSGRGLGLRVVRELVATSGGLLQIESEVDVGTSISAEWDAVKNSSARREKTAIQAGITTGIQTGIQGEAGPIAC